MMEHVEAGLERFPPSSGVWERVVFWGDEDPPPKFWECLSFQGFFGSSRYVIARNAQEWGGAVWKELSNALSAPKEGIWPILCVESQWEWGKPKIPAVAAKTRCMEFADKQGWIWRQPPLDGNSLRRYVQGNAAKLGLKFENEAFEVFCASTVPDARGIANELRKLALISGNGSITRAMLTTDAANPESDAFACVKKLEKGDLSGAWLEISRGNASAMLFFLIAVLSRELRQCWALLMGEKPRMRPGEEAFKKELARALGAHGISGGFCALADAEWQVKNGRRTPEQALEFLVAELAGLFRRGR